MSAEVVAGSPSPSTLSAVLTADNYRFTRWLFLRGLGVIYLLAFASFGVQVLGLIGQEGLLPAAEFLTFLQSRLGEAAFWQAPTLAWISASDRFLLFLCWGGAVLALLLLFNVAAMPVSILLWLFYLSLATVGQVFLGFQWDALLLETGFLAIFLAPLRFWRRQGAAAPSTIVLWLLRLLLFRLMFFSGVVKLFSGDPTWRSLTALAFHYETQPLPTPLAWYAHQLPGAVHSFSVLMTYLIELVVPFFFLVPWRRLRFVAGGLTVLLQLAIFLTGNYTFFNLLTIVLTLVLFDDHFWKTLFPGWLVTRLWRGSAMQPPPPLPARAPLHGILALLIMIASLAQLLALFGQPVPRPAQQMVRRFGPFRLVNRYGLFAVMTTERPQIIVEGSMDGDTWRPYEFRYQPDDVLEAPRWVAPYQPRLDWQLWFAALGSYRQNPWFPNLMLRLLQGSEPVLALMEENPFPDAPPRFVRARLYNYNFTDWETRAETAAWWQRELRGLYFPPVSLEQFPGGNE